MNAANLYNKIRNISALNLPDNLTKYKCDSEVKDYIKSHCYRPVKVKLFDSHLGKFVLREVPCGYCFHCTETKQNEWVTRMYAHCEDYKYIYFLTLTYRSFEKDNSKCASAVMSYLHAAYWHYDSLNSLKRPCFRPCVLVKEHYQNFFKRLRKNTNNPSLTFFGCGEYGFKFGSPHYHFILFSNQPISILDCRRAWGRFLSSDGSDAKNCKDKHFYSFGRIELDDLVQNGTFGKTPVSVDNIKLNPRMCFSYVAKYVGKREYNKSRVSFLVNKIYDSQLLSDFNKVGFNEIYKSFRPFIACSRGVPIGSLYLKRHIEEMVNGTFATPPLQKGTACVVPSYFRRKVSEYIFPFRTDNGSNSFTKSNLPSMAKGLARFLIGSYADDCSKSLAKIPLHDSKGAYIDFIDCSTSPDPAFIKQFSFVDLWSRDRFLLCYNYIIHEPFVCVYHFKRFKGYFLKDTLSLDNFIYLYLTSLSRDMVNYLENLRKYEQAFSYIDFIKTFYVDFGCDNIFAELSAEVEDSNKSYFKFRNSNRFNNSDL